MAASKSAVHEATAPADAEPVQSNGTEPRVLSVEDILAADDIRSEYIDVPEWGGQVRVTALTGSQRNGIARLMKDHGTKVGEMKALELFQARIVAASIGARQEQAEAFNAKSAAALQRVWDVASRLSGLDTDAVDKAAEDLKATPNDDSGSA